MLKKAAFAINKLVCLPDLRFTRIVPGTGWRPSWIRVRPEAGDRAEWYLYERSAHPQGHG